jgi:phosphonate transport system substrate-binding protein
MNRLSRKSLLLFLPLLLLLCLSAVISCKSKDDTRKISLEKREKPEESANVSGQKTLRFAVGAMITPAEGFQYYKKLLGYVEKKSGMKVQYVDRKQYTETNALLKTGSVDVAFVCSGPYVRGRDEFGLDILVMPQINGKAVYYSYIIVHKDSPIAGLKDLRGKTFAFTDPQSNTGRMVPTFMLAKMNETPETFFSRYFYTDNHDKAIMAVAQKNADGAAVDSLIWEYFNKTNPEYTSKTKVIIKSSPYASPPVVAGPHLTAELKEQLRDIFLGMHEDPEGREILNGMQLERFVRGNDSAYASVREMEVFIQQQQKGAKQ